MTARTGGGGRARARLGVSGGLLKQQRSSSSSSSSGGYGRRRAPMAAWEAATRRTQPGSRWSRPEASQGRVRRVPGGRSIISVPSVQALYSSLSDRCGHESSCQDGGSSGYDGRSVRAGGGGGLAARAGGGGRACARSGVSGGRQKQQRSSSSRGGYGRRRAPTAAWEAATRRTQSGRRWSRPEPPGGVAGPRREGSRRSLNHSAQSMKKKCRVVVNVSLDCVSA